MTRILLMGAPYKVENYQARSGADCFEATGRNTGNLLIGNGLVSQLDYDRLESYRYDMSPEYIEENFDQVAIAAANFLFPGFDLSPLSSILDKIKLPAFMVGLGAQMPSSEFNLDDIPEGTWRLVHIVAERSKSIGVRGYFTADQLVKNGVKNIRVTGCPSLYTTLSPSIRIKRPALTEGRIVFNGSRNVVSHSIDKKSAIRVERLLLQEAIRTGSPFVFQNENPEMQVHWGEEPEAHAGALKSLSKFFSIEEADLVSYYRDKGKLFFSVQEWFDWIGDYDFSVGTRFHGNLAALLNGVPAVVVVHDSRTRELCEYAAIPHVMLGDMGEHLGLQKIYESANFDLFEERYNSNFRKYIAFLNENGIKHKLEFNFDLPVRGRIKLS